MEEPILLKVPEAASALNLSVAKVNELIYNDASTGFPSITIGRSRLIPRKQLLEWVEEKLQKKG
jgi:excisionase family DNA binding protein